ncbi:transcription antitermination factor NusB [Actinobacteria bacterium YIM 96077]|uniref:Transcription antitermination protein NusB n=1 Tax=Phytoactinopolyspora halophila TaxID=1981511 RepID=A0A329QJ77_9ACTN|nr:transcription antitermination factor NusB [Phytoactinopolyspora halophila]AYY13564.1 transcription antitermination factor NusB [Actinobacteria bacterium YIM 96077]RAW12380.1 transcription antitermination factor NusB [Phytoactinopolyspora halophila]
MPARSRARKRALDILFESEQQGRPLGSTLSRHRDTPERPLNEYTVTLVEGVIAHRERIDELLATYAEGWSLERMPAVDRNVLRIGAYEVLYCDDVPDPVAISEAVALARDLSTDESPTFVNGLLARLASIKPSTPSG